MTEHSPTPWATDPDDRPDMEWNVHIVERDRPHMRIAFTSNGPDSEANAAFIVKAVNNHDALVKALKAALLIAKQEWDFPGAHPHRAAVVRDMESALGDVGSPVTPENKG